MVDLNLVLLVFGIGGFILNVVNEKGCVECIWVWFFVVDYEFWVKFFLFYDFFMGKINFLDFNIIIEVFDDCYGFYSCDIFDLVVVIFFVFVIIIDLFLFFFVVFV